jgi:hypothetical protein
MVAVVPAVAARAASIAALPEIIRDEQGRRGYARFYWISRQPDAVPGWAPFA